MLHQLTLHTLAQVLTRKPIYASDSEIERNPRARSVRLRVGERTEYEPI